VDAKLQQHILQQLPRLKLVMRGTLTLLGYSSTSFRTCFKAAAAAASIFHQSVGDCVDAKSQQRILQHLLRFRLVMRGTLTLLGYSSTSFSTSCKENSEFKSAAVL
jgi:AraC-like DNA-binding protein